MKKQSFILPCALGMSKRLEDFHYNDVELANLFHTVMNQTDFEGVSVSNIHNNFTFIDSVKTLPGFGLQFPASLQSPPKESIHFCRAEYS